MLTKGEENALRPNSSPDDGCSRRTDAERGDGDSKAGRKVRDEQIGKLAIRQQRGDLGIDQRQPQASRMIPACD